MTFLKRMFRSMATASMLLILIGSSLAWAGSDDDRVTESRALVQTYGADLKAALETAIANGGPIEALDVCKDQAPLIASTLSRQSGANIERVSRRYRNPASAPEPWQVEVLEQFDSANDGDPSLSEHIEHVAGGTRYMKAIRIQPVCLVCHGDVLSDDVRQALDEHYPHDRARNYALGDLRGAFSVSWPALDGSAAPGTVDVGMTNSISNNGANIPMDRLSNEEVNALNDALDDEYKARATYDQVINDFGAVRPFINIRDAESRHIDALRRVYAKYGIEPPPDAHAGAASRFDSVKAACEAAVQAEIENGDLYDRIMGSTDRPDILRVFTNLRDASVERHLPAFQRCLDRNRRGAMN